MLCSVPMGTGSHREHRSGEEHAGPSGVKHRSAGAGDSLSKNLPSTLQLLAMTHKPEFIMKHFNTPDCLSAMHD